MLFVGAGLIVASRESLPDFLFAVFGGGIGAACFVAFVRRVQVIFDRDSNLISIRTRSVYAYTQETYPMNQLRKAVLETTA